MSNELNPSATGSAVAAPPRRRRWLRFRLRTLLLATLAAGVWLGWHMHAVRQQRASIEAVTRLGGWIYYDYEVNETGAYQPDARSWVPSPLLNLLGEDFFHPVVVVNMVYNDDGPQRQDNDQTTDEICYRLGGFPRLRMLLLH